MDLLETPDKDLPLRDDIRLLGRILGDTVRSQEGEPVFAIVEHIRRTSIRFHRDEDEAARHELEATLNSLSHGQSIQIIRAFSYFSQLANIAEDQHHIRRTRAHALAAPDRAKAPWPTRLLALVMRPFPGPSCRDFFHECHRLPGTHRPSDGGEAQEHDRS